MSSHYTWTEVVHLSVMFTCAGTYKSPPSRPHRSHWDQSLTRVQNLPVRLQDLRLNWVPGAPPINTLKLIYMLYATIGLLQPVWGLYGGVLQLASVLSGYVAQ